MEALSKEYKMTFETGDQDWWSFLSWKYPELFYILPCRSDRQTGRMADWQSDMQADSQAGRQADRQTGRQKDRKTERQADPQTEEHTDRQKEKKKN